MSEQATEMDRHPAPPGPPGLPTHEHPDGARCMWVRHNFIDRWRKVDHLGTDLGACPGLGERPRAEKVHIADGSPRPTPHHYMNADGTCHAGDLFESGTDYVVLYAAEELVRIVNGEKAEAWEQGHRDVCTDCNCPDKANPYDDVRYPLGATS